MELIDNLRQMGDSLRANSERLLRDVQSLHTDMVTRIAAAERAAGGPPEEEIRAARSRTGERSAPRETANGEIVDVPEFIPRF
jgi:hypothetical protein